ncbi:MAG: pyridoxal-phosphate dependent enzyme [Patescibacteria group bacterium]|nr:pyridoxal-phosphate dependent enzyme [Patescibacteria group bacterium]
MIYDSIEELIGNTPLVRIHPDVHGLGNVNLYAKLEFYNPFGSVKDRIAKGMLTPLLPDLIKNKKTVVEASSGNTAKALAILCGIHGLPFKTVTNRIKMPEVRMILQTLGADIEELPGLSDCPDPMDPNDFTTVAANLAKAEPDKYHYTDQYFNELNRKSHRQTGAEIHADLNKVDYFFGFLGTCGTTMGAGQYLKDTCDTKVIGVVADAGHHIPGGRNVNELWEVGFFRKDFYEELITGTSQQAIEGMLTLNRRSGILCGPTTGLIYYAAVNKLKDLSHKLPPGETINAVFIACDRVEPYMSYIKKFRPELYSQATTTRKTVHSQTPEEVATAPRIDAQSLSALIASKDALVIDIRGHFAFSIGHIPSSLNILDETFTQIVEEGKTLPQDKKIVVVCRIGDISAKYASYLAGNGYDVFSLDGGITAWKESGFPLQKT